MSIYDIFIPLLFIAGILKQIRYIRALIMPTRKSFVDVICVLVGMIILISITYFNAKTCIHYVAAVLGVLMYVSMWIKQGINSKGFISMYRYKECILWNEIEIVNIISSKDIKIKLTGVFTEQTFRFKKSDYDKVITILKENLPKQVQLQTTLLNAK